MGWTDAPVVSAGAGWQNAPRAEDVVMTTPEGRVVRSQSGTLSFVSPGYSTSDPETIARIMEGEGAGRMARQGAQEDIVSQNPVAARATALVRGTPFLGSYTDELIGMFAGPEAAAGTRALSAAQQQVNPYESLGLGLTGGLLGAAGMAAAAPAGAAGAITGGANATRLGAAGRGLLAGAGAGAAEGAVYGAGEGTDAASRAASAGTGAAIGGVAGGLLGAAAPYIARGAENVAGMIRPSDVDQIAKEMGISKEAATVVRNVFDSGGDINAARAAIIRAGDEGMLADAGPAAQALLDAAANTGGQAGSITRRAIDARMDRTEASLGAAMDTALGPAPLGPRTAVNEIAQRTAPARALAYRTAYDTPINYASPEGMKVEEVIGRIAPDDLIAGITEANKEMLARGEVNQQIMAVLDQNGNVQFLREMPNVRQLDEIKKALQRIAYSPANTDAFGRLTGTGQRYNDLAGQLRDATAAAVPDYGAAVQIGGDKLAEERAFQMGRDLLSPRTELEDVLSTFKRPAPQPRSAAAASQAEIAAAKSGLRSYIAKTLGDVRAIASAPDETAARQVVKAVTDMSSGNARAKIKALMGAEADALLAEIDKAAQSAAVKANLATNSKTAVRRAVQGAAQEMTQGGIVQQAMRGDPLQVSQEVVQAITGQTKKYEAEQVQRMFADVARALTQRKGQSAVAALDYIERAMQGQPLTQAQNRFVAEQVAAALYATGTPALTRAGNEGGR